MSAFETGNKLTVGPDGQELTRTSLTTNSLKVLDLADPQPEAVCIEDIAHGLSQHVRWAGQGRWLSVAQHSVLVVRALELGGEEEVKLPLLRAGLMHDAHEAYIGDLSGGLKYLLRDSTLKLLIRQLDWAIMEAFPRVNIKLKTHEHAMLLAAEEYLVPIEYNLLFKGIKHDLVEGPLCQRLSEELFLSEAARLGVMPRGAV